MQNLNKATAVKSTRAANPRDEKLTLAAVSRMAKNGTRERKKPENQSVETQTAAPPPVFGPLPTFPNQKLWARTVLVLCAVVVAAFLSLRNKETLFASHKAKYEKRVFKLPCSDSYKEELSKFKGCVPEVCGRIVIDTIVSAEEVDALLRVAERGLGLGGSRGGVSILDLQSGALSDGDDFVNFYRLPEFANIFSQDDALLYTVVKNKIREVAAEHFDVDAKSLYLTHPTFFSRMDTAPPRTKSDEYWHKHVDKDTYGTFHFTSIVYLGTYKKDFTGGRFLFVNADNSTAVVEPKRGRVSIFTSGAENAHRVEKVLTGVRYAMTVSFTCDASKAVTNQLLKISQRFA